MAYQKPPPDLPTRIRDLERRMAIVEAQVANRVPVSPTSGGNVFDANVIWNGRFESGFANWAVGQFLFGYTAPDGPVGSDVFATAPGDQWPLSAKIRASQASGGAQIIAMTGTTPPDAQDVTGANTDWVIASSAPLTANVTTTLDGLATVPAGRNYIGFCVVANGIPPSIPWTWWLDDVVMQRRL